MPRRKTVITEDEEDPMRPMTWGQLIRRPAQLIINALAVYAFVHCVTHF